MFINKLFKKFAASETGSMTIDAVQILIAGGFMATAVIVYVASGTEKAADDGRFMIKKQEAVTTF